MEQLYIARKVEERYQWDGDKHIHTGSHIVGFGARYQPGNAKCDKKNRSQDSWAVIGQRWTPNGYVSVPTEPPLIVDNEALPGFTISRSVSRSTTDNKLWRILDPRGFELEIYTGNMEEILTQCTVIKGVIQEKCYWDFGPNGIGKAKLIAEVE